VLRIEEDDKLWSCTIVAEPDVELMAMKGPTYKVDVVVDCIKTRTPLDSGVQVSLA